MSYKYFYVCLFVILSVWANDSFAQRNNDNLRRMNTEEIKRFADHTFWRTHKIDRFYFNGDGTFIQQLNDDWDGIENGTMFTGTWKAENEQLCWTYDEKTALVHKIPQEEFCYTVLTNSPADNFMTTHMETFRLYAAGEENARVAFRWNRYAYDNYIFDPEYVEMVKEGMKTMNEHRRKGFMEGGSTLREDLTPWMQKYYDETINRIFFIAHQSMYFNDKGLYFFITEDGITNAYGDLDKMKANGTFGRWQMKDNIHCWYLSENRSSCEFVMPEGKGLIRPYEGFFGVFYTGFTRVHGEMATGHLDPEETSAPNLFKGLQNELPR